MADLFSDGDGGTATGGGEEHRPLADRLRPASLDEVLGQDHLLCGDGPLARLRATGRIGSLILWGPPGTGKTTIARLLAREVGMEFEQLSAVFAGIADVRKVIDRAARRARAGQKTLLFVDEIHRFNRSQQDGFLPFVEDGTIVLIGATTENPSFEVNGALLSRCQVLPLKALDEASLLALLKRAEDLTGSTLPLDEDGRRTLVAMADGDGRYLLNMAEELFALPEGDVVPADRLGTVLQRRAPLYDKGQEAHYNLISALHKALRGSDTDAALYWLARMLAGGEDPRYILRRMIRFASEDIGLADPQALQQAILARDAYEFIGSPEGDLALAQCAIYLATAPKSNAAYTAFKKAMRSARKHGSLPPPMHAVNAPTKMMKDLGYGKGYVYDHDTEQGSAGLNYFPEEMARENYYRPQERGFEREIAKRLAYWQRIRDVRAGGKDER